MAWSEHLYCVKASSPDVSTARLQHVLEVMICLPSNRENRHVDVSSNISFAKQSKRRFGIFRGELQTLAGRKRGLFQSENIGSSGRFDADNEQPPSAEGSRVQRFPPRLYTFSLVSYFFAVFVAILHRTAHATVGQVIARLGRRKEGSI